MMVEIKEINLSSIAQPAYAKIERNSKGYNYEISVHGEDMDRTLLILENARIRIEKMLYGSEPCVAEIAKKEQV